MSRLLPIADRIERSAERVLAVVVRRAVGALVWAMRRGRFRRWRSDRLGQAP